MCQQILIRIQRVAWSNYGPRVTAFGGSMVFVYNSEAVSIDGCVAVSQAMMTAWL